MLDESAVNTLNVVLFCPLHLQLSIDYAMGQLRMLRGSLATAKEGNIRGRLHLKTNNILMVGSSVSSYSQSDG